MAVDCTFLKDQTIIVEFDCSMCYFENVRKNLFQRSSLQEEYVVFAVCVGNGDLTDHVTPQFSSMGSFKLSSERWCSKGTAQ